MDAEDGNREGPDAGKSEAWRARLRAASTGPLRDPATDEYQQAARAAQDLRRWLDRIGWPREDTPTGGIGPAGDVVIRWGPWAVRAATDLRWAVWADGRHRPWGGSLYCSRSCGGDPAVCAAQCGEVRTDWVDVGTLAEVRAMADQYRPGAFPWDQWRPVVPESDPATPAAGPGAMRQTAPAPKQPRSAPHGWRACGSKIKSEIKEAVRRNPHRGSPQESTDPPQADRAEGGTPLWRGRLTQEGTAQTYWASVRQAEAERAPARVVVMPASIDWREVDATYLDIISRRVWAQRGTAQPWAAVPETERAALAQQVRAVLGALASDGSDGSTAS